MIKFSARKKNRGWKSSTSVAPYKTHVNVFYFEDFLKTNSCEMKNDVRVLRRISIRDLKMFFFQQTNNT